MEERKMADVDNIQETVSPEPNPYNAKKSWHTEEVMPKEGISADSLFVAPKPETQEVSEGESVQQESQPKKENKPYSQPNYKKRYDDLKKHYDSKLNEFRSREQELANKVQQAQPVYEAPKTIEELEKFKQEYPDVYEVVESVAHLQSDSKFKQLADKLNSIEARERDVMRREAEKDLVEKHPDYSELRNSDAFHSWAEKQPEEIQDWIYNNPNNASLASKAIDLFKMESGITEPSNQQNAKSKQKVDASQMISTKTTTVDTNEPKVWTQEEIAALPMDEFDRLESEIDKALDEGRVRG
tara:strand:- start:96 stop:992 length:897 start_codon:yes stop_codon:yes gene_type:complete